MNTLQVKGQCQEGYNEVPKTGKLEPGLLRWYSSAIRGVEDKLGDIEIKPHLRVQ